MKYLVVSILVCFQYSLSIAQLKQPIFKVRQDSIDFEAISKQIQDYFRNPTEGGEFKVDSLMKLRAQIMDRVTGYRWLFSPAFTLSDKLKKSTADTLKAVSVKGKSKIPDEVFLCPNLNTLELVNTRITRLPRKLNKLTKLTTLRIYSNKIKRPLKLSKNSHIKNLIICSDGIPKRFNKYSALEKLDLSKNNLEHMPDLRQCLKLKELVLKDNKLTLADLKPLPGNVLESLELQNNQIQKIPSSLGSFSHLKKLVLNYNQISSIDPAVGQLKNLEQLGLYQNNLSEISEALYELTALKEIDLYYNQVERLSEKAANWVNLEVLYLSNNKLIALPDNIGSLARLKELYLHNNRLSTLPKGITNLNSLRILRINNNYLSELPDRMDKLDLIENMDLSNNKLQAMPEGIFQFKNLKILVLVANPWEDASKDLIHVQAEKLKEKGVVIHYDASPPAIP